MKARSVLKVRYLVCVLGFGLLGSSVSAQTPPADALLKIDGTLQQILVVLEAQAARDANREDARLLMQRLRLQADRLEPLESELKELRLRRTSLEQQLAAGDEQLRQAEERKGTSDFARLLESQIEARAKELNSVEMSLRTLEIRIRDQEDALLSERANYDQLAEAIDERLGLR